MINWSPRSWPNESLTTFNRSRSQNRTAIGASGDADHNAARRYSRRAERLASPVKGSVNARIKKASRSRLMSTLACCNRVTVRTIRAANTVKRHTARAFNTSGLPLGTRFTPLRVKTAATVMAIGPHTRHRFGEPQQSS